MKSLIKLSIVAAMLMLMVSTAAALSVIPLFNEGAEVILSDNSAEYLIKGAGNDPNSTLLVEGDRLRGLFSIGTFESATVNNPFTSIGAGTQYNELTGFFDIQVTEKTDLAVELGLADPDDWYTLFPGIDRFSFTFDPYAGFATEVETLIGATAGSLAGTMIATFEDSAQNYSRIETGALTTEEDLIGTAKDGTYLFSLGFEGIAGEGWSATAISDDVGNFTAPGASNSGKFNFGLNILDNATYLQFSDVLGVFGLADLVGSGSLIGPVGDTPFDVFDNIDMTVNTTVVPEPSTLLLLGFGLAGLGVIVRKKKNS